MSSIPYRRKSSARRFALLGVALVALAACGTVYRPGDERASCAELQSEIASNEARIAALLATAEAAEESGSLRPTGILVGMSFALTRTGESERTEAHSLQRRNGLLFKYASNKDC